jgi:hypothetical protein
MSWKGCGFKLYLKHPSLKKIPKFRDSKAYDVGWCNHLVSQPKELFSSSIESSQIKGGNILDSPIVQKY